MGRNIEDVIQSLPADRQAKIADLSNKKIAEMLTYAATLADFRKAVGKTQAEVAKKLGINQNAVSQLENRADTYVSTLRRFLKSLGMTLELSVVAKNGARIDLPNFLPWTDASETADDLTAPAITATSIADAAKPTASSAKKISAKAAVGQTATAKAAPAKRAVVPSKPASKRNQAKLRKHVGRISEA
ncbi:helix-turn-helix domain-containing protein [Oxalobacteraceae bacterium OTU3REALA1]|nr:helix-turn-helix domain-containing protein [Oxalobacteraceae bacterium OTU3REALA1]